MRTIKLTQGQETLIDDEDFQKVNKHKWYALMDKTGKFRAVRNIYVKGKWEKKEYLHRLLMNFPNNDVDHIDSNSLNNRKLNLRICTHHQNLMNSLKHHKNKSGYKGVSWHKNVKQWVSQIQFNRKKMTIGYFPSKIHAAMAYDIWAKELFGEFAKLNFN